MPTTAKLGMTLMASSALQKEVIFNEAIIILDALANPTALSITTTAPPGSPTSGDTYIIPVGATGAWAGRDNQIAIFFNGWRYVQPIEGVFVWVDDESDTFRFDGDDWIVNTLVITGLSSIPDVDIPAPDLVTGAVLTYDAVSETYGLVLPTLSGQSDVDVTGLLDGQVLVWDEDTSTWVPAAAGGDTSGLQATSEKGEADGYAPLNGNSKVPKRYIPSFTNDVLEYDELGDFPGTGEAGKIYVALDTGFNYRWDVGTSDYVLTTATGDQYQWFIESGAPDDDEGVDGNHYIDSDTNEVYRKEAGAWGSPLLDLSGSAGNTILNGTVDPTTEGTDGDFYIRTDTSVLFGPKAGGTWPSGVSLVGTDGVDGDDGVDGVDGNTILNGTVAPTTEGVNGDFYIDTVTNLIYGPKAGGTWPSGIPLGGADGDDGDDGADGADGEDADVTRSSTTSRTLGTGSRSLTYSATSPNIGWAIGTRLRFYHNSTNYMEGPITAVDGTSVTIDADLVVGLGTYASWTISIAGDRGAAGSNGTSFPAFTIDTYTASRVATSGDFAGNKLIKMNVGSANDYTINTGLTGIEPVSIYQMGAGQVTIVPGGGVTIVSSQGLKTRAQHSVLTIIPNGTDSYIVSGDTVV